MQYRWRVVERSGPTVPTLDPDQQLVVDHATGPLLVLAGPGTGKTTTLVEAIAQKIDAGVAPEQILALTFGRKAAVELRDRVTARLGRTLTAPICMTFHSFAYALIRRFAPTDLYDAPLRLITAAEQDVQLRELLQVHPEAISWPPFLKRALGTRGFANELTQVLGRARELGLDGAALGALGRDRGAPELISAGAFLDQYLDVLDQLGSTDYADLIRRAQLEAGEHQAELRATYSHVFVDEYQDTDPGQVALLQLLAGDGRNLVAVGDPNQSIYAFRGAQVRGILDFPTQFPTSQGQNAPVVVLRTTRRFGPNLLATAGRVASRLSLAGSIGARSQAEFLSPVAKGYQHGEGRVEVRTFDSARAEAEHLADLLRRAHLEDGLDWSEMAILVRSGTVSIPPLRRALLAAGVPVEVATDEIPLTQEPAVAALLHALRAALNLSIQDPGHKDYITASVAVELLSGPLVALDASDLRALARVLRRRDRAWATEAGRSPLPAEELLRRVVVEEGFCSGLDPSDPALARARALNPLLVAVEQQVRSRASVEEVLWTLWSGSEWPQRLKRASERVGNAGRRAHRDLDSMVALFEMAARTEERRGHSGVRNFLELLVDQQIPTDLLVTREDPITGVRLLTAHRAKGLEWRLVVVAQVQQDLWPDLRARGTLLGEALASATGTQTTTRETLMEERRLFYVACTRARERLVITAVDSMDEDGETPSRFLQEVAPSGHRHISGRPTRPLTMDGLVAQLRRTAADPQASTPLREAAARRLAGLVSEQGPHGPLAPAADPANWWGLAATTRSPAPLRSAEAPVVLSASALGDIITCPARWFFVREAGGRSSSGQQANLGTLIHAIAEQVATDTTPGPTKDLDQLMIQVDQVWDRFTFATPWSSARARDRVRLALERFLVWHQANARTFLAAEQRFDTELSLADGVRLRINGSIDRLELDAAGQLVVVDFKTGKNPISAPKVATDPQLALYQLALTRGAALPQYGVRTSGAEIVQLGLDDARPARVTGQEELHPDGALARDLEAELARAERLIRAEEFPATPGPACASCEFWSICPARSAGSVLSQ